MSLPALDKQYSFVYNTSGWNDQLIRIDVSNNIPCDNEDGYCWCTNSVFNSYNSIGHPTVHKGLALSWVQGNKLAFYNGISFTYASTGMRLTKGNNTTYEYEGDKLIKETRNGTTIEYLYGANGIIGFRYGGTNYYYIKNAFGDVTSVIDHVGRVYAEYVYDAFGNCTITYDPYGIGSLNPIRYRSYYYDTETGLYYLKTRYYDPEIGRFISPADTSTLNPSSINGLNLYDYANNNPIILKYCSCCGTTSFNGGLTTSIGSSVVSGGNLSLPPLPIWTEWLSTALDAFSSFVGVFETSAWAMTSSGKAFSDFHYAAYGINRFTMLDELTSPLGKICKAIGIGLIFADLGMNVYNSVQQGFSFVQGATSFALTAVKDIGIYYASTKVASAVGGYIAGSKLGATLGSFAGPAGMIIGAAAGFVAGYIIDEFGDIIIESIIGLFD